MQRLRQELWFVYFMAHTSSASVRYVSVLIVGVIRFLNDSVSVALQFPVCYLTWFFFLESLCLCIRSLHICSNVITLFLAVLISPETIPWLPPNPENSGQLRSVPCYSKRVGSSRAFPVIVAHTVNFKPVLVVAAGHFRPAGLRGLHKIWYKQYLKHRCVCIIAFKETSRSFCGSLPSFLSLDSCSGVLVFFLLDHL